MTDPIPEGNYSPTWTGAQRPEVPPTGDERAVLTTLLDFHRATFEAKCTGVHPSRLREHAVPPSTLSLHGLARPLPTSRRGAESVRRRAIVGGRSLDDTGTRRRDGQPVSVRFVLAHMIAEYARHNGHADLLRERVDGTTGA